MKIKIFKPLVPDEGSNLNDSTLENSPSPISWDLSLAKTYEIHVLRPARVTFINMAPTFRPSHLQMPGGPKITRTH